MEERFGDVTVTRGRQLRGHRRDAPATRELLRSRGDPVVGRCVRGPRCGSRLPGHPLVCRGQALLRRGEPRGRRRRTRGMAGPPRGPTRWTSRRPGCSVPGRPWWRRSRARPSEPASGWRVWPTSGSAAPRHGLPPTSPGSVTTTSSASRSRCRPSSASSTPSNLLYTGRRLKGEEALAIGLCDRLVGRRRVARSRRTPWRRRSPPAHRSRCAPSARPCAPGCPIDSVLPPTREAAVQEVLESTWDLTEGVRAAKERRPARFEAR